jgi:HD-like signal output (HDOD) protein
MIKNWLTGWLGAAPAVPAKHTQAPAAARSASAAPAASPTAAPAGNIAPADIDPDFYRWLTGADQRAAASGVERLLLDELRRLAESPGAGAHLVPRVPAVIPRLLRSLRDDSMSAADLSRMLAQDVVLVAEVIRSANSPFYRSGTPVKTLEAALMLLGQNGMRLLLARVAFRPVISAQAGNLARLAAPQVWRHAEKCALAASLLAPRLGANPFEAYLAGLMQNVGLIVALRLFDQLYPDAVLPQSAQFHAALAEHARTLSARIAGMWEFSPAVASAIAQAGHPGMGALPRTLAQADRIAKLRMLVDAGQADMDDPALLAGLDEAMLVCFSQLKAEQD